VVYAVLIHIGVYMRVYINEFHPVYQVVVDDEVYDTMISRGRHFPLTRSQQWDIAAGYKEYLGRPWDSLTE
jgi:hypothetical protein